MWTYSLCESQAGDRVARLAARSPNHAAGGVPRGGQNADRGGDDGDNGEDARGVGAERGGGLGGGSGRGAGRNLRVRGCLCCPGFAGLRQADGVGDALLDDHLDQALDDLGNEPTEGIAGTAGTLDPLRQRTSRGRGEISQRRGREMVDLPFEVAPILKELGQLRMRAPHFRGASPLRGCGGERGRGELSRGLIDLI